MHIPLKILTTLTSLKEPKEKSRLMTPIKVTIKVIRLSTRTVTILEAHTMANGMVMEHIIGTLVTFLKENGLTEKERAQGFYIIQKQVINIIMKEDGKTIKSLIADICTTKMELNKECITTALEMNLITMKNGGNNLTAQVDIT